MPAQDGARRKVMRPDRQIWVGVWYWAIVALGFAVAGVVWRSKALGLPHALAAEAVIVLGLLPALWLRRQARQPVVPLLALVGIFHAVYFGLSLLTADATRYNGKLKIYALNLAEPLALRSVLLTLLGLVCLYAGYGLAVRLMARMPSAKLPPVPEGAAARLILAASFAVVLASVVLPGVRQFGSFNQVLEFCRFLLVGAAVMLWARGHATMYEKVAIVLVVLPLTIIEVRSLSLLTFPIYMTIWAIILGWRLRGKEFPLFLFIFFAICAGALYEAKSYYKKKVEFSNHLAERGIDNSTQFPDWETLFHINGSDFYRRISYSLVFYEVVEKTPSAVPYWNGETYANVVSNLVPRFLWKDKPTERFGGEFGRRYGFLNPQDGTTSLNIPWLIEAYINFGTVGLIFAMAAIGALLACLSRWFLSTSATAVESVIGGALVFRLGFPESNFSVMTGSIPAMAALLYGGAWLVWLAFRRLGRA